MEFSTKSTERCHLKCETITIILTIEKPTVCDVGLVCILTARLRDKDMRLELSTGAILANSPLGERRSPPVVDTVAFTTPGTLMLIPPPIELSAGSGDTPEVFGNLNCK